MTFRLSAASLAFSAATIVAALSATPALAHDVTYWHSGAQAKVYQNAAAPAWAGTTATQTALPMTLSAAQSEFEGRQVVLKPTGGGIKDIWIQSSDLVSTDASGNVSSLSGSEAEVFKVHYVYVKYPSYGQKRVGWEPDALLPMTLANGNRLGASYRSASNLQAQPYYVLFHVPEGTPAGTYEGTLTVTATSDDGDALPAIELPVQLTVYPFSIAAKTLKTAFGVDLRWAMYAGSASHMWLGYNPTPDASRVPERTTFKADQMGGWFRYLSEHRVSPQTLAPAWQTGANGLTPTSSGSNVMRPSYMADYIGTGAATNYAGDRFGFNTIKMPEYSPPTYVRNPFSSSTTYHQAGKYYSTMRSQLGTNYSKAYVYPIDEPVASKRSFIERYTALVHKYAPGVKFLITTDPITWNYKPLAGVDIYVQRLQFYYRDYSKWVYPLRKSGKSVWIYSHASSWQSQVPNYLVDKPLTDPRSQGWFAYHTNAGGLLYFNVNAWRPDLGSGTYRDPYKDPISFRATYNGKPMYANGDGSLLYPGYYPSLGLTVQGAPPVGSLRFEALRDGIEDYEYAKLLEKKVGRTSTLTYVSKVVGPPKTVVQSGRATFPAFPTYGSAYISARDAMAARISR